MLEVQELRAGLSVSIDLVRQAGLRLGDVEITVVPKLRAETLLSLLRYAYGLRNLHLLPPTAHATQALGFQDILVWQLVEESKELLARGLRRAYVRREEALASPRGRIDFQAMTGRGSLVEAALPCVHHRGDQDRPINRASWRACDGCLDRRRPGAEGQGEAARRPAWGGHRHDPTGSGGLPTTGGRDGPDDQALRARHLADPHPPRAAGCPWARRRTGRACPASCST